MQNKQVVQSQNKFKSILSRSRVPIVLAACAVLAVAITYVLYAYTQTLLKERLQERLVAIVSTIAQEIEPSDILAVRGIEDLESSEMERLVAQLGKLREANENITYAYIMRRTNDPDIYEFIADADSLATVEELDLNENGEIEEEEMVPLPGDPFDVSPYPTLKNEAFFHPVAADELEEDQWSVQLSSYAPILDAEGRAVAIVGIDVVVDDFKSRTQTMLQPFILFILFLILLLALLTVMLVRFYGEREDALKELDKQKDELLSIVSHQLATPVSSIKWYLEMMKDGDVGKLTQKQVKHVESMEDITANLVDLVQMILDVSRIQLDRIKVDPIPLDLNKFFMEIMGVIDPKAIQRNIDFEKSIPNKLPTIMLDKRLTRMTFENLLSNAVKYTPENGKVWFSIEKKKSSILCTVKDTGCGIPSADQGKIFGKLYRASNVQEVDGNGFGLYIAKGAIEAQGGKIWFESKEGKGTTFYVELPIK